VTNVPATGQRMARWRSPIATRVVSGGLTVLFLSLAVLLAADPGGDWSAADLLWLLLLLPGAAISASLGSGYIDLYPDRVVLDGLFRRRREVRLAAIVSVEPEQFSLCFRLGPHEGISGPGTIGAKSPLLHLLRVHTRGDRIAETIMDAAAAAAADAADAATE
jgi:hypothetical protein